MGFNYSKKSHFVYRYKCFIKIPYLLLGVIKCMLITIVKCKYFCEIECI